MTKTTNTSQSTKGEPPKLKLRLAEIISILLIAALGFCVDVYDINIFSVVRIASFVSLGVPAAQILSIGIFILNMQMLGMIVGGFIWGILGDKKGRKFALFGSILLYSIATFFTGFVHSIFAYAVLRFIAGIGLAGEVGAAIIIVAEVTPSKYRTYATGFVRGLGLLGAILACLVGDRLPWRLVYITAGLGGLLLLLARMSIKETVLFVKLLENPRVKRGSLKLFFSDTKRLLRLIRCFLAGVPQWFLHGVLIAFAPEICRGADPTSAVVKVATVMLCSSCGQVFGEVLAGVISQLIHSRKLVMLVFTSAGAITSIVLLKGAIQYYALLCIPVGFFMGYASVVLTTTAEQFGTNLRATATTLVPNFFRASAIPITLLFSLLSSSSMGIINSTLVTGAICFALALISILFMEETYAKDLDFIET